MGKTNGSNSEVRSDVSCAAKATVFHHRNTTVDNIDIYLKWKVGVLEVELKHELDMKRECCKRKRPRCQLCYEERSWQKYPGCRRKFIALNRIKEINLKEKKGIKEATV
jgi:hypothetical protein